MANFAFCVHGHFYQPSREDPENGNIPQEQGAAPYHDWNQKIHERCYRPNAEQHNFERISYNIGPTLFKWMNGYDANTTARIIAQDRLNYDRYGVGNAMAQPYHHTILPLSPRQDKETQVRWGIADFETRFGHHPSGMWLPETAVDLETLDVLAQCGIQYTILAPWQAAVDPVDVTQPYWVQTSSGRRIAVFFYEAELSGRVSFDASATVNADRFAEEILMPKFNAYSGGKDPRYILIASDGELYGHHQPYREKFLSYLTTTALRNRSLECVFPGLWLRLHPPRETIQIREETSWSCHHGLSRWKEGCGCVPHGEWKAPLRQALDQISNLLDDVYLERAGSLFENPWEIRHRYVTVLQGKARMEELITAVMERQPTQGELQTVDLLLRSQLDRQRMFTSCGWFFEDFDRIEPRNVVAYSAFACYWTYLATGEDVASKAVQLLRPVRSLRTGLRAESVFNYYYQRAREMYTLPYFSAQMVG